MVITAIYFKDKDFCHLKIKDAYFSPDHLKVNGTVVSPTRDANGVLNYVVDGKDIKVEGAVRKSVVSHYMNRETEDIISVTEYKDRLASFKNQDGSYKDLESEYMYRKTEQTYVAVMRTYYDYEELPVVFEEAFLKPDAYCECSGMVKKSNDENYPNHFVFAFNKWKFANDTVIKIMAEFGVPRVLHASDAKSVEHYVLHDNEREYRWLEICGSEYFITHDDMFGKNTKKEYIYGAYKEVVAWEANIEKCLRDRIALAIDRQRTVKVKKSSIQSVREKLDKLSKTLFDKKVTKSDIAVAVNSIINDFYEMANVR